MSEILAQVTRGPMVESVHRGSVAVTNGARQAFTGHERTAFRYG